MPLKLMYITNNPEIAVIAENAGVDRIFVDMEFIGKDVRQGGLDTIQNHHTIQDIKNIRKAVHQSSKPDDFSIFGHNRDLLIMNLHYKVHNIIIRF